MNIRLSVGSLIGASALGALLLAPVPAADASVLVRNIGNGAYDIIRGVARNPALREKVQDISVNAAGDLIIAGLAAATADGAAQALQHLEVVPEQRAARAADSTLEIFTTPPQASIEFVGSALEYSPGMRLPAGDYRLRVSAPGFRSETLSLRHEQGRASRSVAVLVPDQAMQCRPPETLSVQRGTTATIYEAAYVVGPIGEVNLLEGLLDQLEAQGFTPFSAALEPDRVRLEVGYPARAGRRVQPVSQAQPHAAYRFDIQPHPGVHLHRFTVRLSLPNNAYVWSEGNFHRSVCGLIGSL